MEAELFPELADTPPPPTIQHARAADAVLKEIYTGRPGEITEYTSFPNREDRRKYLRAKYGKEWWHYAEPGDISSIELKKLRGY